MPKDKAVYQDAFNQMAPAITKPGETLNSPNLKGGITVSKELIPEDVVAGDVILLRVADIDLEKGEVHFEYLNKQETKPGEVIIPPVPTANLNTL